MTRFGKGIETWDVMAFERMLNAAERIPGFTLATSLTIEVYPEGAVIARTAIGIAGGHG